MGGAILWLHPLKPEPQACLRRSTSWLEMLAEHWHRASRVFQLSDALLRDGGGPLGSLWGAEPSVRHVRQVKQQSRSFPLKLPKPLSP